MWVNVLDFYCAIIGKKRRVTYRLDTIENDEISFNLWLIFIVAQHKLHWISIVCIWMKRVRNLKLLISKVNKICKGWLNENYIFFFENLNFERNYWTCKDLFSWYKLLSLFKDSIQFLNSNFKFYLFFV